MADNDDNKDDKTDDKVDLTQLTEALSDLPQGVQDAVKTAIREVSQEQANARAANQVDDDPDDDDNEDPDFDVERVSRSELVNHIDKRFLKALKTALKPIEDRLETTSDAAETDRVKREFFAAKEKFSDFMEWAEELGAIVKSNPELTAEDMYLLARARHPEKAAEVDKKAKEKKGEEDEKAGKGKAPSFGGLTPTSGASLTRDTKKQPKEAAESAWEEVMGDVPDSIIGQALEG